MNFMMKHLSKYIYACMNLSLEFIRKTMSKGPCHGGAAIFLPGFAINQSQNQVIWQLYMLTKNNFWFSWLIEMYHDTLLTFNICQQLWLKHVIAWSYVISCCMSHTNDIYIENKWELEPTNKDPVSCPWTEVNSEMSNYCEYLWRKLTAL